MRDTRKLMFARLLALGFLVSILALSPAMQTGAWAHGVNVFAYVEGDTIMVEGYFSKSAKAKGCLVEVFDSGGKKLLEGKTDDKGIVSFKLSDLPQVQGDIKFVLNAGQGHKADYVLSSDELPQTAQKGSASLAAAAPAVESPPAQGEEKKEQPQVAAPDAQLIARAVEEAVARQMKPVVKMLGNQQKLLLELQHSGPTLRDVVGGFGWIFGLVGVAAYFMSRKARGSQ